MSIQIYVDGKFYNKEEAKISVFDHGLLYGDRYLKRRAYGRSFNSMNTSTGCMTPPK